jgi:8-oxo-dGTP pyrophosphatase MutT (NUDIX family)
VSDPAKAEQSRKVIAYVLDRSDRLLVFRHRDSPEAGLQVPSGSVNAAEPPEAAVLREVREETGLVELSEPQFLGRFRYDMSRYSRAEIQIRSVYQIQLEQEAPESWTYFETNGGSVQPIAFELFWMNLNDPALKLEGGQGYLLGRLHPLRN